MKLFRLKSNPNTIVQKSEEYHRVFWAKSMFSGYDARWMVARWNKDNVIPLSKEEIKDTLENVNIFEKMLGNFVKLG